MTTFVVKQSEASFEARFASPVFTLLGPTGLDLHQNMFLSLRKHGLTLGDIRVESGSSNLSGANVTYGLNMFNAFVRVWMDRVEVSFADLRRVSLDQMLEITGIALDVIQRLVQNIEMALYTASWRMHGIPQDVEISQFTAQYVKNAPEGLGPVVSSGVVYYFGPEAERQSSAFVIDRSAVVPGAVFLSAAVIFDGAMLPMAHSPSAAQDYLSKMLASMHLEPSWES